jgi:hypothetical protein
VDLSPLAPAGLLASLRHAVREKRWHQALLATPDHLLAVGVLDAGALAVGTVWVVDRARGEVVFDRAAAGLPGLNSRIGVRPGVGARTSFAAPGMEVVLERRSDRFQLTVELAVDLTLRVLLDTRGAPDPFALVAPLPEGGVRAAQQTGPLAVEGDLTIRGTRHRLVGALAALDFGVGLFQEEVAWRKVTAVGHLGDGRPLLLHLAEGLDGVEPQDGGEDVILVGPGPFPLPPVVVEADPQTPTAAWRLASQDGAVALTFQPSASHRESRELLLVSTRRTQLLGSLSGRIPGPDGGALELTAVPALAEDLSARW